MAEQEQQISQEQYNEALQQYQQERQLEMQKKMLLKRLLDNKAYERIMRIRLSSPERYDQLIEIIARLAQSGQLKTKMGEPQLVEILNKITQQTNRETKINVLRK